MSADLDYITGRIPTYRGYGDEANRHDSDKRVRAIVGESLTEAHVRFGRDLDAAQSAAYESLIFQCMFGDQSFVRKIDRETLTEAKLAAMVSADRALVELEERLNAAAAVADFVALIDEVRTHLASRTALA